MKRIISLFALPLIVMSFTVSQTVQFTELFQIAYKTSFDGLEGLKNQKTGKWVFENASKDFDIYEVKYDTQIGLHYMNFIREMNSAETAGFMVDRYRMQIENLLPFGYELRSESSKGKKLVFEFSSDKANYPTVEIFSEGDDKSGWMTIRLTEPVIRSSVKKKN